MSAYESTIHQFRKIYNSHVKGDKKRVEEVVRDITIYMVRKNVNTFYDFDQWADNGEKALIAERLGLTENNGILLVLKKKLPQINTN